VSPRIALFVGVLAACFPGLAASQATPPAQPPACAGPEHRQFDFWVGTWDVATPAGKPAGSNRIERVLDGCVLLEHWTGQGGGSGKSFSMYVAAEKQWSQTWVDSSGNRIVLTGGWKGDRMVLANAWKGRDGKDMASDLTWTPLPDGRVRQVWRQSSDGGATWTTTFDGLYTKRP
jgi:hypothetical protein